MIEPKINLFGYEVLARLGEWGHFILNSSVLNSSPVMFAQYPDFLALSGKVDQNWVIRLINNVCK